MADAAATRRPGRRACRSERRAADWFGSTVNEALDEHAERLALNSALVARRCRQRLYTDTTAREQQRQTIANIDQSLSWLLASDRTCQAIELIGAVGDDRPAGWR